MEENNSYRTYSGITYSIPTLQSTSCSGGTITHIYTPSPDDNDGIIAYTLTLHELRSCRGFESITKEQAEAIIQALSQFSALCYQAILNE